ncbi:enoyl-CoA hydratase [Agrococcus citreus]|uniref:Enoyl-CoA hydratase n=1 Tax=Agrococcus citreus TaxID=84643 RepID=A0ABN1YVQ5_9MICO
MSKVDIERHDDGLRVITLNDPERRNILDAAMCADLLAAVEEVAADPDATALVVTGAGTAFCGGADMPAVFGDRERSVAQIRDDLHEVYRSFLAIRELKIPTISAVQGPAVGAGLNLAMVCDIRIAGPDAAFSATFSRIGLHPGGGCTWFLVQAMGQDRALKMLLDGGTKRGADAVASGVATHFADEPLAAALKLGGRYAALDAQLARDIKAAVAIAASGTLSATLEFESWAQASAATKPEVHEYIRGFQK